MLITKEEVIKAVGLKKLGLSWLADPLMSFFKVKQVNETYGKIKHLEQDAFIDQLLKELNVEVELSEGWKGFIPAKGPVILIANHPNGALDGICLFKAIRQHRPDFAFMGNFLLTRIKQMEGMVIPVNPLKKYKGAYNSLGGLRAALNFLSDGGAMGMFPAANMSNFQLSSMKIEDPEWNLSAIKFIRKANCPIVPVFIHGHNSWRFQLASFISRDLKVVQQIPETFKKSGKKIKISIGKAVNNDRSVKSENPKELRKFLRDAVYQLR